MAIANSYSTTTDAYPLLTRDQEIDLFARLAAGDETARETLILSNVGLVRKFAMQNGPLMPVQDLIQEGMFGLMRAVEKFNPELGFRFSTYAIWWVRQSVQRCIPNLINIVRVPTYMQTRIRSLEKAEVVFTASEGHPPDDSDLAAFMQLNIEQIEECRQAMIGQRPSLSLDFSKGDLSNRDPEAPSLQESWQESEESDVQERIDTKRVVASLSPKSQHVLIHRLGLFGNPARTLGDIGDEVGISREAVRLREERAKKEVLAFMSRDAKSELRKRAS